MANQTYTVTIDINSKGATVVVQNIGALAKQARIAQTSIFSLQRALGGLGAAFSVREIIRMADAVTNLRNRIGLFAKSAAETRVITKELFEIAAATRSDFETTGHVYTRLALSARNLGKSQEELLRVTKAINQAVILSGTGAREAANGLIQLSQAIASNRLGGDELRSVLEQLPLVTDIIGKELVSLGLATRGTRAEVRQLGFDGKITSEIIVNAFLNAADVLEKQFAGTVPTIGQAFEVLQTRFTEFISDMNDATGIAGQLAQALILVADNISTVARVLAALALPAILATAVRGAVFLAATFGNWIALLSVAASLLVTFSDRIVVSRENGVTLLNAFHGVAIVGRELFATFGDGVSKLVGGLGLGTSLLGVFIDLLIKGLEKLAELTRFSPLTGVFSGTAEAIKAARELARVEAEKGHVRASIRAQEDAIAKKALADRTTAPPPLPTKDEIKDAERFIDIMRKLRSEGGILAQTLGDTARAREIENEILQISLQFENGLSETQKGLIRTQLNLNAAMADQHEIMDELNGPMETYAQTLDAINKLLFELPDQTDKLNRKLVENRVALLDTETSVAAGFERGFLKIGLQVTDFAATAEDALVGSFNAATDALTDFVLTGQLSIADLENFMLESFTRLAIQAAVLAPLAQFLGIAPGSTSSTGGIGGFLSSFFGQAGTPSAGAPATVSTDPMQHGGSFMVPGAGPTDSRLVAFRASPGEHVMVTPRGEDVDRNGRRPVAINFNITTPDAESFARSQGQLLARTQAAMMRAHRRNN